MAPTDLDVALEEIEGRLLGDDTIPADLRHVSDETTGDERDREILKIEAI